MPRLALSIHQLSLAGTLIRELRAHCTRTGSGRASLAITMTLDKELDIWTAEELIGTHVRLRWPELRVTIRRPTEHYLALAMEVPDDTVPPSMILRVIAEIVEAVASRPTQP